MSDAFALKRLQDLDWVALDIEATGVAWGHDRVVELGAVRFRFNALGQIVPGPRFHSLVDPGQPIPEVVSRITGLTDETVRGAPPLDAIWSDFESFIRDTAVIAHGARSDLSWLGAEALRLSRAPIATPFFCTLELARKAIKDAPRFTLAALTAHLGLVSEGADFHRALADAIHTRNVFARCTSLIGATTLLELGWDRPLLWPTAESYAISIPPRLEVLRELSAQQERCLIVYRGGSAGRAPRPVTPLGFFAMDRVTYLRAWCHLTDTAKSFRCDRIAAVSCVSQPVS